MYQPPLGERIVNRSIELALRAVCRLDATELRKVARTGPTILISNHTTNIEGPALYVLIQPRKATALGKVELWENPLTRGLMNLWDIIPVHRGQVDSGALRASLEALENGYLLGVAPEGTRSKTGKLTRGARGAALLALRSAAPVCPTAQTGLRDIGRNLRHLRRAPVSFRVGRPFIVRVPDDAQPTSSVLRTIADEMMYQIALLLPEQFRGVYSDLSRLTTNYLEFLEPGAPEPVPVSP